MRNKHDILNQHKKLHRIADIFTKYFFRQNSSCTYPQPFFLNSTLQSTTGQLQAKKYVVKMSAIRLLIWNIMFISHQDQLSRVETLKYSIRRGQIVCFVVVHHGRFLGKFAVWTQDYRRCQLVAREKLYKTDYKELQFL